MDPLTLVATTITLVESVSATYKLIQHLSGLPKAFEKVNESLPLSREILQSARDELQNRQTIAPNVAEPISATLKTCQAKLDTLLNIFQKIEEKNKEHQQSKDGKEWSVVSIYHSTLQNAGRMTKAHRVEALMQDIMNKLKALAINQVFKTATQAQVGRLEVAIQELAKVEPSIPDADLDDAGSLNATQNVAAGGKGNQAINRGGHQDNTFGHRFDTGGGKMTFVYSDNRDDDNHRPSYSNIPSNRGLYFVGRTHLMHDIDQSFRDRLQGSNHPVILVLWGMGGRGKSRVALQYCQMRDRAGCRGIFWINALSEETTIRSLQQIAEKISIESQSRNPLSKSLSWNTLAAELSTWTDPWLLVFDNHDDPVRFHNLASFFPLHGKGSIIITTRHEPFGQASSWERMEVPDMTEEEALSLLVGRVSGKNLSETEVAAGKQIVNMLGYLPMAINQAGWHISNHRLGLHDYLLIFNERKKEVIGETPTGTTWSYERGEKEENWHTTYEYSLEILDKGIKDAAISFLTLSAFFGEATILEDYFKAYYSAKDSNTRPGWLSYFGSSDAWDLLAFRKLIVHLGNQGLVQVRKEVPPASGIDNHPVVSRDVQIRSNVHLQSDQYIQPPLNGVHYSLHLVIREWLRFRLPPPLGDQASEAVAVLAAFLQSTDINKMSFQTRLDVITHINVFIKDKVTSLNHGFGLRGLDSDIPPALLFAVFCRDFSHLLIAKNLLGDLLKAREAAQVPDSDPRTVEIDIELGQTLADNAEHSVAEKHFDHALEHSSNIGRRLKCRALIGKARVLETERDLQAARPVVTEALELAEAESNHDKGALLVQATLLLGTIQGELGHLSVAKQLGDKALEMAEERLGPTHIYTLVAHTLNANYLVAVGEIAEANRTFKRTLETLTKHHGQSHRLALYTLVRLGQLYAQANQLDDARQYYQEALSRGEVLMGHTPLLVDVTTFIGWTYVAEKKYVEAETCFREAWKQCTGKEGWDKDGWKRSDVLKDGAVKDGFELAFLNASWALYLLYATQREFRKIVAFFHPAYGLIFPWKFMLRTNKFRIISITAGVLLFGYYIIRGHLLATLIICGTVGAIGTLALR